jgi:beta-lactam-binding protein with PASTA domain
MSKITTFRQAVMSRAMADAIVEAKHAELVANQKRIAQILRANPQIGTCTRKGRTVYYAFPADGVYVESFDPAELI